MSLDTTLRAAVIGLGKAGSRFDEDKSPPRWSHVGAYLACPSDFRVIGGADPSADARDRFAKRCPDARVVDDPVALVAETKPDVISVCTPPAGRSELVQRMLRAHVPRVVACEKPLEVDDRAREELVRACATANVPLVVNYTRRFETAWRSARRAIADGRIGRVVSITVRAPNRLWSIGSHAIDTLTYLAGGPPQRWYAEPRPSLVEMDEPAADAVFVFGGDVVGHLITTGMRAVIIFEADIIGSDGRIQVLDNGARSTLSRYAAYSSFGTATTGDVEVIATRESDFSPFVEMVEEIALVARGRLDAASSTGANAVVTESLLSSIAAQCTSDPRRNQ